MRVQTRVTEEPQDNRLKLGIQRTYIRPVKGKRREISQMMTREANHKHGEGVECQVQTLECNEVTKEKPKRETETEQRNRSD